MRLAQRLILGALILGALFIGANVAVEKVAESRVAKSAQESFHSPLPPSVSFDSFPILIGLLKGHLGNATIEGKDLLLDDLRVAEGRLVLQDIRANLSDLSKGGSITVTTGSARAAVSQTAFNEFLLRRDWHVVVVFGNGVATVRAAISSGFNAEATGVARIEKGSLVFVPTSIRLVGTTEVLPAWLEAKARSVLTIRESLPKLPGGVQIDGVVLTSGRATFSAKIANAVLDLGEPATG